MATASDGAYSFEYNNDLNTYFIYENASGRKRVLAAIQDTKKEAERVFNILKKADPSKALTNSRDIIYEYPKKLF